MARSVFCCKAKNEGDEGPHASARYDLRLASCAAAVAAVADRAGGGRFVGGEEVGRGLVVVVVQKEIRRRLVVVQKEVRFRFRRRFRFR